LMEWQWFWSAYDSNNRRTSRSER